MSGAITSSGGGFPALGQVIARSAQIAVSMNKLTAQASDGLVADSFGGLGAQAPAALSLAPQISALQSVQNTIGSASGALQVTQTAMTGIQSIASDLLAALPNLNGLNAQNVDTVAAQARSDLGQMADLLNNQFGGVYVFSGQDTANPPVPNPDGILTSGFFTRIQSAVAGLGTNGAAATAAATLSIAGSNAAGTSPFSSYLSQPRGSIALPSIPVGVGQSLPVGLTASANSTAVSSGASTTGSYMRDLMRALATIGSLTSAQVNDPGFAGLVSDTRTSLTGAITAMSTDVGDLGEQQSQLTTTQTGLGDTVTALTGQLSSAQDVDMASTLSNLTLTQNRLQMSYQLISMTAGMTLAKFLGVSA